MSEMFEALEKRMEKLEAEVDLVAELKKITKHLERIADVLEEWQK